MRKYLTIGELADLMKVTTSSIRYYEQEGLLSPYKIDDNGYRLYDYSEIDRLEMILLLRKLDVPLKQLKTIINDYSIDTYIETLAASLTSIDSRIEQLNSKRQYVVNKLNHVENLKKIKTTYQITNIPERELYCLHTGRIYKYSVKETYQIFKSQNIDFLGTNQDTYMLPLDNDIFNFCILKSPDMESVENFDKLLLQKGSYLNYSAFVQDYDEIDVETAKFYDYMKKNELYPKDKLIIIENVNSNLYLNTIYLKLQIRLKN